MLPQMTRNAAFARTTALLPPVVGATWTSTAATSSSPSSSFCPSSPNLPPIESSETIHPSSPRQSSTSSSSFCSSSSPSSDMILPKREYATKAYTWDELYDIIVCRNDVSILARSVEQERVYQKYRQELKRTWKSVYDHILHTKFQFDKRPVDGADALVVVVEDDDRALIEKKGNAIVSKDCNNNGRHCSSDFSEVMTNPAVEEEEKKNSPSPRDIVWEAYPPLSQVHTIQKSLCLNDFPYYFDENIEHWVLWKLCAPVTEDDIQQAKNDLKEVQNNKGEGAGEVVDTLHWINPPHLKSLPDIDHVHILCLRKK